MQGHRAILFSLRFFCVLQALAGVAFIVSSSLIVFPPVASAFIILLWIIGGFTIVVAIVGVLAAVPSRIKCCMTPYLTLTGIAMSMQTALVVYLMIAPGAAVDSAVEAWSSRHPAEDPPQSKIHDAVYISRWVLLGFTGAQLVGIMAFIVQYSCTLQRVRGWKRFVAEDAAARPDEPQQQAKQKSCQEHIESTESKLAQLRPAKFSLKAKNNSNVVSLKPKSAVDSMQRSFVRNQASSEDKFGDIEIGAIRLPRAMQMETQLESFRHHDRSASLRTGPVKESQNYSFRSQPDVGGTRGHRTTWALALQNNSSDHSVP